MFILFFFQFIIFVSGFVIKIISCIVNEEFFKQILEVGIFCQFEGLFSCYGDEMGMIEDFCVVVDDLKFVRFQFVKIDDLSVFLIVFQDG